MVLGYVEICMLRWKKLQKLIIFINMSFPELLTSKNFYGTLGVFNRLALFSEISSVHNLFTLWTTRIHDSGAYRNFWFTVEKVAEICFFLTMCHFSNFWRQRNFYGTSIVFNRLALFSEISSAHNLFTLWTTRIRDSGAYRNFWFTMEKVAEICFLWQYVIS